MPSNGDLGRSGRPHPFRGRRWRRGTPLRRAGEHRVVGEERRRRHLSDTVAVGVGDHGCVPVSQEENTGAVQLQWMVDLETVRLVRSPPVLSVLDVGGEPGGLTGVEEDGREVVHCRQNGARSDGVTLAPNPYSSYCWSELQNAPVSPATRMRLRTSRGATVGHADQEADE